MNERLRELRIELHLSQEDFGSRIGIKSRAHISALENGTRNITDRIIFDICREFNVNEGWLRYGEGEIFDELSDDEEMMALIGKLCADGNPKKLMALRTAARIIESDVCWSIIESELNKYISEYEKE